MVGGWSAQATRGLVRGENGAKRQEFRLFAAKGRALVWCLSDAWERKAGNGNRGRPPEYLAGPLVVLCMLEA
jgi:hypothetical protein